MPVIQLSSDLPGAGPHEQSSEVMISIESISKKYGPTFQVLKDCSTTVAKGEVVVVCGPSGSGKSTLIKCVNGLEPVQQGTIIIDGIRVTDKGTNLPKLPGSRRHGVSTLRAVSPSPDRGEPLPGAAKGARPLP
jgi:energy-coupling factor transporter ATP-binding protein EcfA2